MPTPSSPVALDQLLADIRRCRACEAELPCGPRPVLAAHQDARILIIGQAPGRRVHESGVPWDDPSGERLRQWMGIDPAVFYDPTKIAIVPMGFCYPGTGKSGDLPPRPECAQLWHDPLLAELSRLKLTLVIGQYAQQYRLGNRRKKTLTQTVQAWKEYRPACLALPHPSPRNNIWLKKRFIREFSGAQLKTTAALWDRGVAYTPTPTEAAVVEVPRYRRARRLARLPGGTRRSP